MKISARLENDKSINPQKQISDAQYRIASRKHCANKKNEQKKTKPFSTFDLCYAYSQFYLILETKNNSTYASL